jgi:hypothetical protein
VDDWWRICVVGGAGFGHGILLELVNVQLMRQHTCRFSMSDQRMTSCLDGYDGPTTLKLPSPPPSSTIKEVGDD